MKFSRCDRADYVQRHSTNITLENHVESVPVVMYLLNNIQDNFEYDSAYGSYIQPGTVMRCDGRVRRQREQADISVVFMSFPFFDIGSGNIPDPPEDEALHLPRALFQQFYPHEETSDRDRSQQFRNFAQVKSGQYLRVPQLWVLILNSTVTITCGPASIVDLARDRLEIVAGDSLLSTDQQLIHVTDFYQRVTLLKPEQCTSYLALEQTIEKECLDDEETGIDRCILHLGDSNEPLDPSLWPALLRNTQGSLIYLRLSRKDPPTIKQDNSALGIEGPDPRLMITYTDLDSDNGSTRGKELTLYRSGPM
jgi:hypothetical protein